MRYDHPFYVGCQNQKRFPYAKNGWLPALEPDIQEEVKEEPEWSKRQWGFVRQLEARLLHTEQKMMEIRAKKKEEDVF